MRSEEVQNRINEDAKQLKMIMKYRLFGRDGVSKKEFNELIALNIVKKRHDYNDNLQAMANARQKRNEEAEKALKAQQE